MTETKAERYVTYAEFDDFKKHDFQEVRDDIKDIRSDLSGNEGGYQGAECQYEAND